MVFLRRRGISKGAGCPDKSIKLLNAETGLCSNRSLESSEWCPQFLLLHHHYHHRPSPSGLDLLVEVRVCNLARKKTQHHSTGRRDLRRLRSRLTELGSGRNWAAGRSRHSGCSRLRAPADPAKPARSTRCDSPGG